MGRLRVVRAFLVALVTLIVTLPASASGARVEIFHSGLFQEIPDVEVCGITAEFVAEGVFTDKFFFDEEHNLTRFQSTASGKQTFTTANGKSVTIQFAQQYSEAAPVEEEPGTISFVFSYKGLPEKIQTTRGPVLLRDAGLVVFVNTIDLETHEISTEVIVHKGPQPDLESEFTRFCEVVSEALV